MTWFDPNLYLWVKIEMIRSESTHMFGISVPGEIFLIAINIILRTHTSIIQYQPILFWQAIKSEMFQFCLGLDVTLSQNVPNDRKHKLCPNPKGRINIHKSESLCQFYQEKIKAFQYYFSKNQRPCKIWTVKVLKPFQLN